MTADVFGIVGATVAGAFHVEAVVAEGGFAVIYRAHHGGFRAPVALKCLKIPQRLGPRAESEFLEQFRAEAELLFLLSSSISAVVRPLHVDAITTPTGAFMPFMALEWLEGETLEAIATRRKGEGLRPLSLKKLARLLTPVARALERAHHFNGPGGPVSIVHRDLKPENIFVASVAGEQVVKILDFGIAKAKSMASQVAGRTSQSTAGKAPFTPAYGAPEKWSPKRFGQTGPWTDVWGLALTMVEVAAGYPIIDGDPAAMMGAAIDPAHRPTPRAVGIQVSDAVEQVFARALAVDPGTRQRHCGQFWDELLEALEMKADGRGLLPARDLRSEGGKIPQVDHIGAGLASLAASSSEPPRSHEVATLPAPPEASGNGQPSSLDLGVPLVPELTLEAPPVSQRRAREPSSSAPAMQELELDDAGKLDLALDLDSGELPVARPGANPGGQNHRGGASFGWDSMPPPSGQAAPLLSTPPWAEPNVEARRFASSQPGSLAPAPSALQFSPLPPRSSSGPPSVGTGQRPRSDAPDARAPEPEVSLVRRLGPGSGLILLAVLITLADQAYASHAGEVFSLGPLRAGVVAALAMLAGLVLVVQGLMPDGRS